MTDEKGTDNAQLVDATCGTFDGVVKLTVADLAGTETVVSSAGTSTPTIAAGEITFTVGTCWDLVLSSGHIFYITEGSGTDVYNVGSGDNAVLVGGTYPNFWTDNTQDIFHSNYFYGFSNVVRCENVGATHRYLDTGIIPSASTKLEIVGKVDNLANLVAVGGRNQSSIANARFYIGVYNGKWSLGFGSASITVGTPFINADTDVHTFLLENGILYVDGVLAHDQSSATFSSATTTYALKAGHVTGLTANSVAIIYSIKVDDVEYFNNGTLVNGASRVKAPADTTNPALDVLGNTLTNPPKTGLNDCESKIDFPLAVSTAYVVTDPLAYADFESDFGSNHEVFSCMKALDYGTLLFYNPALSVGYTNKLIRCLEKNKCINISHNASGDIIYNASGVIVYTLV